jgi:hypothetical protein
MRKMLLLVALFSLFAISMTPVLAAEPASLVIEASKPGGPVIGDFASSGAFSDEGTIEIIEEHVVGLESQRLLVNHVTYEFEGADGTFTVASQNRLIFGATGSTVDAHWVVTGGTGAYEGLRGQGSLDGAFDFGTGLFTLLFTGQVQL